MVFFFVNLSKHFNKDCSFDGREIWFYDITTHKYSYIQHNRGTIFLSVRKCFLDIQADNKTEETDNKKINN